MSILEEIERDLVDRGFSFERKDFNRPWGGFFVIEEDQKDLFLDTYYPGADKSELTKGGKVSPKILLVMPDKRLSWQYHHRRSEVWKVVGGRVGVVKSPTDEQGEVQELELEDQVILAQGERHRLVGLNEHGIVAEIWQHTDPDNPSDEDDIVRLADDFGR